MVENLKNEFPELFTNCFGGCGAGDGWYPLLKKLCEDISAAVKAIPKSKINVEQVKEKFGLLRFYWSVIDGPPELFEKITFLVDDAEKRSGTICEECGDTGCLFEKPSGWLKTYCQECANKAGAE